MPTLHDAFIDQLKDTYNAEKQIVEALPKMAKAASTSELRQAFEQHLDQTRGHIQRLESIFEKLDTKPGGKKCHGMEGLIQEGEEAIEDFSEGAARDALLIAGAQRVEHYEIAAYGTVAAWAEEMGHDEMARTLRETLDEESETDEKLTALATGGIVETGVNEAAKTAR